MKSGEDILLGRMLEGKLSAKTEKKPPTQEVEMPFAEKHYRPTDLARKWSLSPSKVRHMFKGVPDVKYIGQLGSSGRRSYTTMLIPASVAQRVYDSMPTLPAAS